MKAILLLTLGSLGLIGSSISYGSWNQLSVWSKNKIASNSIEGHIKAIAVDDDGDQILLKVKQTGSSGKTELLRFCSEGYLDVTNQFVSSEQMELIRTAMAKGHPVQLTYESFFNRCLSRVTYSGEQLAKEKSQAL